MMVRVIDRPMDSVAIVSPMRQRDDGESLADYYADVFDRALQRSPELLGLPYADIEQSTLPATREHRDRWRLVNGRVIVAPQEDQ